MKTTVSILALIPLMLACGQDEAPAPDTSSASAVSAASSDGVEADAVSQDAQIAVWFDEQWEMFLLDNPMFLTNLGRKERFDELGDFSVAEQDRQLAAAQASLAEMEATFDYDQLSPENQLSYDLWKYTIEEQVLDAEFRGNAYIFNQMFGTHTQLPTFMINFHRVESDEDMVAYIARLNEFDDALGQLVIQARDNAAGGVRPPRFAYDVVLEQSRGLITGAPFDDGDDNAIWADAKAKIDALVAAETIDADRADELRAAAEAALLDAYQTAYTEIIGFLESDYDNSAEIGTGVGGDPNGEAYYARRLASWTTTDLTPDQVHQTGLEEVARLRGEMESIMTQVDFDGDLQDFFIHVRDADWNYYPDTDEGRQAYIDDATAAIDNIKDQLPNYFGILPRADLEVRRVEAFREQDGAAQHYNAGTADGSRPGVYYAHLSDMTAMPKNQLEVIAYHEGLPGHHMQIMIARELENTPQFRTILNFGAYAEGWALYTELLAKEIPGTYQDPYSDFGRLTTEMWRAIRLVVDTGLHSQGWTEEDAIAYFQANSPEPFESIQSEVRRYIVLPGQATSYKIGMLRIQAMRAYAEETLGDDFDIRAFHDTILGGGGLPMDLLDRRVRTWVASVQAG